jgi:23S rRNA pseudoU1915 N3-methylase RlmH
MKISTYSLGTQIKHLLESTYRKYLKYMEKYLKKVPTVNAAEVPKESKVSKCNYKCLKKAMGELKWVGTWVGVIIIFRV